MTHQSLLKIWTWDAIASSFDECKTIRMRRKVGLPDVVYLLSRYVNHPTKVCERGSHYTFFDILSVFTAAMILSNIAFIGSHPAIRAWTELTSTL